MKFKRQIKQLRDTKYYLNLDIRDICLQVVIFILIIANSVVTVSLVKYLSTRQNQRNVDRIANSYLQTISDRFLNHLNKNIDSQEGTIKSSPETLNKYLSVINPNPLTQIALIKSDGVIISNNSPELNEQLTLSNQDILVNLQQELGTLSRLDREITLDLTIKQQDWLTQVTPWNSPAQNLKYLVVVTIPKSTSLINHAIEQNNWGSQSWAYFLPTIILSLITSISATSLIYRRHPNQSSKNNLIQAKKITTPTNEEQKQSKLSPNQDSLILEQLETIKNNSAYVLLAKMSHELRSPLNAILGFAQIMEQELSPTQANLDNIAMINRNGERLLSIINDVVDLAKIESNLLSLEHNNIDFDAWLNNIEQSFKFQAQNQGWDFSLQKSSNLPKYICVDERRLRQIIRNLINYCLKSNPIASIDLTVVSDSRTQESDETNIQNQNKKYNICFEFKSPNSIVTHQELTTLFDPIIRVQQEREYAEGSSLNLPISQKLAQLMGGNINVTRNSIERSGIIFNLAIQTESIIAQKLQIQSTMKRIVGLESDQTEYRILVVDDSKTNRTIMSQLLESVGFQVQEAVNGSEAIDVWLNWQPHMIWMDLKMPVMDGCEATERIRSYSSNVHTPIVALSASTLEEEKALIKAAGCDDFVGKPFSENIIFDKIAEHLGIRYVYESTIPANVSSFKLIPRTLNVMPNEWLNQVEQAAIELNQDLLTNLLQEIPAEHQDLKNALQKQINNFDFDRILYLTKNSHNN